jgi:hypothetical protein
VVKLAEKFVPILVDGDVEKDLCAKYGARGYPHTVFADPKGEAVGNVGGFVPTSTFLSKMESAVKKIGPVRLKKAAKDLEEAGQALAKARAKKEWKAILKAVAVIEKVNHEGAILDAAREARKEAAAEARKRVDEAVDLRKTGKVDDARRILLKVSSDFDGLDEAAEAKALLKEMDATPPPPK